MKHGCLVCLSLCVTATLLLIVDPPAQAQTGAVLYNFTGRGDGAYLFTHLTPDGAGNFYGTTARGGVGYGTVFELSPNGSGGWSESVLYSFTGGVDGAYPDLSYLIFDDAGNLYGTAYQGGTSGYGVVFELIPVEGSWTETVLYSFANDGDGALPANGLMFDPAGNLYGSTYIGGDNNDGTVFKLSQSGGVWTEQVIYEGDGQCGNQSPGLIMDATGNIFGGTVNTIFELSPNGNGGWTPTLIQVVSGTGDCAEATPLFDKAGNLYGTTKVGGANVAGTVYKLTPVTKGKKKGTWTERILYSFKGVTDGYEPQAGIVFDAAGNIYGTTLYTGKGSAKHPPGNGTVFELAAPVGKGSYKEKVLLNFNGTDGRYPYDSLFLDSASNLYGTTYNGGSSESGVVFELNPSAAATTTMLSSSPNPSIGGQAVTFTAVVSSGAGAPPDGEIVSFMDGATVLGTGALGGGSASFPTVALKVGTTTVTGVYGGDLNFIGSTSNKVKQVVEKN